MQHNAETPVAIQMFAWATPKQGMALDELIAHLKEIGNEILEVDRPNNRVKIADITEDL